MRSKNKRASEDQDDDAFKFFEEDVVVKVSTSKKSASRSKKQLLGVIQRVAGHEDEGQEDEDEEPLPEGHAEVLWANDETTEEKIQNLQLVDRALLHGDIVSYIENAYENQSGTVIDVNLHVDVRFVNGGHVLRNVHSKHLQSANPFKNGVYGVYEDWLCRIEDCLMNIHLQFRDGSRCVVKEADVDDFFKEDDDSVDDDLPFYPGQILMINNSRSQKAVRDAQWLQGSYKKALHKEAVVLNVVPAEVFAEFITTYSAETEAPDEIDIKKLKMFDYYSYSNWMLFDRGLVTPETKALSAEQLFADPSKQTAQSESETQQPSTSTTASPAGVSTDNTGDNDAHEEKDDSNQQQKPKPKKKKKQTNGTAASSETNGAKKQDPILANRTNQCVEIIATRTLVDVMWQDGTITREIESTKLMPVQHIQDYDFWPLDFVTHKTAFEEDSGSNNKEQQQEGNTAATNVVKSRNDDNDDGSDLSSVSDYSHKRVGIVRTVDAAERTCHVLWLTRDNNQSTADTTVQEPYVPETEVLSVYELESHPYYDYQLGSVVLRMPGSAANVTDNSNTANSDSSEPNTTQSESQTQHTETVPESNTSDWVGEIVRINDDGTLVVHWISGDISTVKFDEVYLLEEDEQDDDEDYDDEEYDEDEDGSDSDDNDGTGPRINANTLINSLLRQRARHRRGTRNSDEEDDSDSASVQSWETVDDDVDGEDSNRDEQANQNADSDNNSDSAQVDPLTQNVIDNILQQFYAGRSTGFTRRSAAAAAVADAIEAALPIQLNNDELADDNADDIDNDSGLIGYGPPPAGRLIGYGPPSSETKDSTAESQPALRETADEGDEHEDRVNDVDAELQSIKAEITSRTQQQNTTPITDNSAQSPAAEDQSKESATAQLEANVQYPERFQVVESVKDHHFGPNPNDTSSKRFFNAVRKEWKILKENLPANIYVITYESRMDLLRAVIIGPSNTPYNDGLYIFDMQLPEDYPARSPNIFFHSYGDKLNPNLYDDGHICLSLFGTWVAKEQCEGWNPETSNILQVLVSIMGLILNQEPYYNEAGYQKQIGTAEGIRNSRMYNEQCFLLVLSHMMKTIRNPPAHTEPLIRAHFAARGPHIIARIEKLLARADSTQSSQQQPQPSTSSEASTSSQRSSTHDENGLDVERAGSVGFLRMLQKLLPKLKAAFLAGSR